MCPFKLDHLSSSPHSPGAHSVAADSLGRVYVGGRRGDFGSYNGAIFRYNLDGSDDATFNFDGLYEMFEGFGAMALDSRSRVVAGTGYRYGSRVYFKIFRLNSAGELDGTFGSGGVKISDIEGGVAALAIHPDQRITVAGPSGGNFALLRYTYNGAQDNTFGSGGIVVDSVPSGVTTVNSIAHYPIGSKTVVLYTDRDYTGNIGALRRYNYDGTRDRLFSGDGELIFRY